MQNSTSAICADLNTALLTELPCIESDLIGGRVIHMISGYSNMNNNKFNLDSQMLFFSLIRLIKSIMFPWREILPL